MAARDVPELVGDHALELVHIIRGEDQPGMNIDRLAGRDEGINRRIIEQDDVDARRIELGRADQRRRDVLEQQLGLAVAENRNRAFLRRSRLPADICQQECQHQQAREAGHGRSHRPAITIFASEQAMKNGRQP